MHVYMQIAYKRVGTRSINCGHDTVTTHYCYTLLSHSYNPVSLFQHVIKARCDLMISFHRIIQAWPRFTTYFYVVLYDFILPNASGQAPYKPVALRRSSGLYGSAREPAQASLQAHVASSSCDSLTRVLIKLFVMRHCALSPLKNRPPDWN